MEKGEWVVAAGLIFLCGILVAALLPDRFRIPPPSSPNIVPEQTLVRAQTGPNVMMSLPGQNNTLQMIPVVATQVAPGQQDPGQGQGQGQGQGTGLILLQTAPRVNFKGVVQQISEQPQSDGQLHLWLKDTNGVETRVSVGPGWFLQYLGCPLAHDIQVSGAGFTFQKEGMNPLVYAKRVEINGKVCQLRNDDGFALWSNKFR